MSVDLHAKSHELLEILANSIHDRNPASLTPFTFKVSEIHATERWLKDFIKEIQRDCICV